MRRWPALAAVVLIAIVLRSVAIVHLRPWNTPPEENRVIAQNLAAGNGFTFADFSSIGPTTVRPPLYPFCLAGFDLVFGAGSKAALCAALALNVLAGAAAVLLMAAILRRAFDDRIALFGAALFAIWPTQIFAAAQFQGLSLAVALVLAALYLCQRRWPLAAGIIAGLAVLCESILLLPLLIAGIWSFRRQIDGLILLPFALLAIAFPWAYRNTLVRERPTLITGQFAMDLFRGNGPDATGSQHLAARGSDGKPLSEFDLLAQQQFDSLRHQSEAHRDTILYGWAATWISQHRVDYARLCLVRALKTFWLDWNHPLSHNLLNLAARSLLSAAALAAVAGYAIRSKSLISPVMAMSGFILIGLILASMFTLAEARNSVLADVPQLLLAASLLKQKAA